MTGGVHAASLMVVLASARSTWNGRQIAGVRSLPEPRGDFEFPGLQVDAVSGSVTFAGDRTWSWSGVEV